MKKLILSFLIIVSISYNTYSQDILSLCASPIIEGDTVELQIITTGFTNIGGFQFALAWELSKLNFISVGNENTNLSGLAYNQIDDQQTIGLGVLRSLWFHPDGLSETLDDDSSIYSIFFTATDPSDIGSIGIVPHNEFPIEIIKVEGANVTTIDPVIDNTGCNTLSFTAFTTDLENIKISEVHVFPNPVRDVLELQSTDIHSGNIEIYNAQGKVVHLQKVINQTKVILHVQSLTPGYYSIQYLDIDGLKIKQAKFIKI